MENNVTLRSCNGTEFLVKEEVAKLSEVLGTLLNRESPFEEAISRSVTLPIKAIALKRAIEYLEYKHKYLGCEGPIPDFEVSEEESLDLLSVSFYLKI